MAMIAEAVAATKLCHFAKATSERAEEQWVGSIAGCDVAITGVNRRFGGAPHPDCMCLHKGCMAWFDGGGVGFCTAADDNRN